MEWTLCVCKVYVSLAVDRAYVMHQKEDAKEMLRMNLLKRRLKWLVLLYLLPFFLYLINKDLSFTYMHDKGCITLGLDHEEGNFS